MWREIRGMFAVWLTTTALLLLIIANLQPHTVTLWTPTPPSCELIIVTLRVPVGIYANGRHQTNYGIVQRIVLQCPSVDGKVRMGR